MKTTKITPEEQIAAKAKPMLLEFHELLTLDERISNSVFLAGGVSSYHAKDAAEKAKVIGEHTRRFICHAGISLYGVNKDVARVLRLDGLTRLKAFHPVNYGGDFPMLRVEGNEQYANVTDLQLKLAPRTTQEGAARDMITMIERAEQIAIRANPPKNCKGYVERADYPITSLYSDYKDMIELGAHDWADYQAERKNWRQCKYMYCLNMFPTAADNFMYMQAKRKDARYCCDGCRVAQKDADVRYKTTGSHLPVYYYVPKLTETVNDAARLYESAYEGEDIESQLHENAYAGREDVHIKMRRTVDKGTRGGVMTKFKSNDEAKAAYEKADRSGWYKIS